jgi:hypothetical protein
MAEVLAEHQELFFETGTVVFENHDVVNALLQFFLVLLLEGVCVKHEEIAVIAADPGHAVVHAAAEQPVTRGLTHYLRLQGLRVKHVQLVALASRVDDT